MTLIVLILRTLGLPLVIVMAFLGFYEGVPFLRDIPFIDRVPVVRELVAGRVATESAKAAAAARAGYVLQVQAAAALALSNEYKRQMDVQQTVIDAYQIQYKNALAREAEQDADTEKAIALNNQKRTAAGRKCDPIDQSDIDFLR